MFKPFCWCFPKDFRSFCLALPGLLEGDLFFSRQTQVYQDVLLLLCLGNLRKHAELALESYVFVFVTIDY